MLCLVILGGSPLGATPASRAPEGANRWSGLADTLFRHFTSPEMRYASAMAQDAEGFIWLATQDGLVRWDGYQSRVYHAEIPAVTALPDQTALPDNHVLSLHTDQRGRLWVGTAGGGLARYDPQRDDFEVLGADDPLLRGASVSAIAADGGTGLWVGTSKGLHHVDLATMALASVAPAGQSTGPVEAVLQDRDGSLWLGTERGLLRRSPGSDEFRGVTLDVAGGIPVVEVLRRDSGGNLWIGTRRDGAFVIEPGQTVARAVHETAKPSPLEGEPVLAIVEANPGEIWLGTGEGGVVIVDTAWGWHTRRLRYEVELSTSLQDENVHTMFRDRSGLIWVASTMAMNVHDPRQIGISTLFGAANGNKPITAVQVPFVLAMPDGRVWLSAGDDGGIDILDPAAGRVGGLRADPLHPLNNLPGGRVLAMATASDGDVYIGTRHGLYRADPRGRQVVRVEIPQRASDAPVWTLYFDGDTLWLGGTDGLWALRRKAPDALSILRHETAERLGRERVSAILRGRGSTLWVGTGSGLYRLDIASDEWERMPTDAADPTALVDGYVTSLLIDAQSRLWVASLGVGIQILEGRTPQGRPRFRRLGMREGLPHNDIDELLPDARGNIWASTDHGLAVIDPASFAVRTLGEPQGVAILQYWSNSGARTAAGELLFGGQGGLTVVRPELASPAHYRPPLVITEAHAGGKTLVSSRFNVSGAPRRLQVPADDRSLMVEFSALDYTAPADNRYGYRLEGFDKDWVATQSTRRLAAYTNLPPGDYTLQLRGSEHEAPWTSTTLDMSIRVLPAWYETAWFRISAGALALAAVAAMMQLRTALLRDRQFQLEALVAERTSELEQRSAELQQRSVELRESQRQLERIAYLDPLTGMPNRRLFDTELAHLAALAQRGAGNFTLLLIDLDRFKQINDTLGHDAGDALLIEVSRRLVATLRQTDRSFRLGGDEFAVLLAETGEPAGVEAACQRILQDVAQPFVYRDQPLQPGASIGAARWSAGASGAEALYKCADLALYDAKRAGRNTSRCRTLSS